MVGANYIWLSAIALAATKTAGMATVKTTTIRVKFEMKPAHDPRGPVDTVKGHTADPFSELRAPPGRHITGAYVDMAGWVIVRPAPAAEKTAGSTKPDGQHLLRGAVVVASGDEPQRVEINHGEKHRHLVVTTRKYYENQRVLARGNDRGGDGGGDALLRTPPAPPTFPRLLRPTSIMIRRLGPSGPVDALLNRGNGAYDEDDEDDEDGDDEDEWRGYDDEGDNNKGGATTSGKGDRATPRMCDSHLVRGNPVVLGAIAVPSTAPSTTNSNSRKLPPAAVPPKVSIMEVK